MQWEGEKKGVAPPGALQPDGSSLRRNTLEVCMWRRGNKYRGTVDRILDSLATWLDGQ